MSHKTSLFAVALSSLIATALPQAAKAVIVGTYNSGSYNTPADLGLSAATNFLALDLGNTTAGPTPTNYTAGGVTFVADNTSFQNNGGGNFTAIGGATTPS